MRLRCLAAVVTSLPARLLITSGLLALLAVVIDWQSVTAALARATWGWVAVAVALVLVGSLVAALRWRIFLHAAGLAVSRPNALRAYLAGTFSNNFLPTGFGGDAVRGVLVARSGPPLPRALTSVVADRGSALACLLALAWVAVAVEAGEVPGALVGLLAGATMLVGAVGGGLVLVLRRRGLARFLPAVLRPSAGEVARVLRAYGRDRSLQVEVTALGFAFQALMMTAFWLVAVALQLDLSIAQLTVVVPLALLAAALPISIAGFGVREGAFVVLLASYGVSAADATLLSLLLVAIVAVASAPGALALALAGASSTAAAER